MADLDDKREARRKRILENSENRLKRIKSVLETKTEDVTVTSMNKMKQTNSYEEGPSLSTTSPHTFPSLINNFNLIQNRNVPPVEESHFERRSLNGRQQENDAAPNSAATINNNYYIQSDNRHLILTLLVCSFYIGKFLCGNLLMYDLSMLLFLNHIFSPFLLYQVIDLAKNFTLESETLNSSTPINYLMFFMKMRKLDNYVWIVKLLLKISNVMQDMMVYFFVFVCFESVLGVFSR